MIKAYILGLILLVSLPIKADELFEITPNTSRCDILRALNHDRVPDECNPCPRGCKGQFIAPVRKRAVLSNVLFANNSDQLTAIAEDTLRNIASAMNEMTNEHYHIFGHTNRTGAYDYNMRLSERRAQSVRRFLAQSGVSQQRLATKGFGYNQPFTPDPTDGINRRVEFVNAREVQP
jgi:outer membrane protein OmpA-like peptidoglycan-associated protein